MKGSNGSHTCQPNGTSYELCGHITWLQSLVGHSHNHHTIKALELVYKSAKARTENKRTILKSPDSTRFLSSDGSTLKNNAHAPAPPSCITVTSCNRALLKQNIE
ncbi:hypothetical protein L798_03313 [Zootermopsis nevadensis]|uniref:Uncharacterized protein n=1 Tax=Zootermopsis nevadensis TaxID=136037 RepID=A0A067RFL9_ZOONE|nr:hypothetical protein L798_03313 [Zootermopsis nevadensis]